MARSEGAMDGKNVVQVQIFGHTYTIRGEANQEYILEVAAYVDRKMREITEKLPMSCTRSARNGTSSRNSWNLARRDSMPFSTICSRTALLGNAGGSPKVRSDFPALFVMHRKFLNH
jgi:Cell division protein ZapA